MRYSSRQTQMEGAWMFFLIVIVIWGTWALVIPVLRGIYRWSQNQKRQRNACLPPVENRPYNKKHMKACYNQGKAFGACFGNAMKGRVY